MPQVKSLILINGTESPKELTVKIMDIQRQLENRITAIEAALARIRDRLEDLED
jgi:hypothetical protein